MASTAVLTSQTEATGMVLIQAQHYNHLARTTNQAKQAEYKRWVESHTPDQIQEANSARRQLRRKYPTAKGKAAKWPAIHDERAVKLPLSAYQQFVSNRLNSGDFKNIPPVERMKLIAQEWNALNVSEKEVSQSTCHCRFIPNDPLFYRNTRICTPKTMIAVSRMKGDPQIKRQSGRN